jgi:hypothetical protein
MLEAGAGCASLVRATLAALGAFALMGCHDAETAAVIEVQSDLGTSLTRVDIDVRDALDQVSGDQFSFDSATNPSYRVPFSFRIARRAASEFVIKASGYDHAEVRTATKLRVRLNQGQTLHRTLFLSAACAHVDCGDGLTCNPLDRSCQAITESSTPGGASNTQFDAGTPGADASAADGGQDSGAADSGGRPMSTQPNADAGASPAAGSDGRSTPPASGAGGTAGAGGAGGSSDDGSISTDTDAGVDNRGRLVRKQWTQVDHGGHGYVVWNTVNYDDVDETLTFDETAFTVTNVSSDHADDDIATFPSVYLGSLYYMDSADSSLPKQVSTIRSIALTFNDNADKVLGSFNAVCAAWLNTSAERQGDVATGGFVEIWFYPHSGQTPFGTIIQHGATVPGVTGTWDVWLGSDAGLLSMVYERTEPITSFDGDLNPFLVDATQRPNGLPGTWYLAALLTGFEIANGGTGLHADPISIVVN